MKWHVQFSRYALVGLASNAIGYLLYLLISGAGIGHKTTMSLLYVTGVGLTFCLNRNWSFGHGGAVSNTLVRYALAYLVGYLVNFGLLWVAVDHLGFPHQVVQLVSIFMVAGLVFLMHRYWVFTPTLKGK